MGARANPSRTSGKSKQTYPYTPEYSFEVSSEIVRNERAHIVDIISKTVHNKKHFGHFFDGERKSTISYFSSLIKRAPKELLMVLSKFSKRDEKSVSDMYSVAPLAYIIGISRGMRGRELDDLSLGSLIHDLGKDGILPYDDLHSEGPLTDEEWKIMRLHPERGAKTIDMLNAYLLSRYGKSAVISGGVRQTALEHQVYYDSEDGYPDLGGAKPCRKAQAAKLADSFHTLRIRVGKPLREGLVDIVHRTKRGEYNPHMVFTLIQLCRKDKSDPKKTGIGETKKIICGERRSYSS